MKLFDVVIRFKDDNETSTAVFAQLENQEEQKMYDEEEYDKLFADTGYCEDNVTYFLSPEEKLSEGFDACFAVVEKIYD